MPLRCKLIVGFFFLEIPSYKANLPKKAGSYSEWQKEHQRVARAQQQMSAH